MDWFLRVPIGKLPLAYSPAEMLWIIISLFVTIAAPNSITIPIIMIYVIGLIILAKASHSKKESSGGDKP